MIKIRMPAASSALFNRSSRHLAFLLLAWLGASPLPASAGAHTTAASGEIRPAAIYHNYCSVCHGDKGDGHSRAQGSLVPPPRNFTTSEAATLLTRARMIESVTNGRSGTAMTGWKTQLSQKEIEAVVDYVRNTFMPANATADSNRGRIVYSRNCAVCHGDRGDGRSRAQGSLNPPPRDFTAPAARAELTPERMIMSITYGRPETAMAGFKTQLSKEDINAVVSYIRTGFMGTNDTAGISGTSSGARHGRPQGMPGTGMPSSTKTLVADMSVPMPNGLKGDAVKGAAFYMSNCATCHGTTGDGRGPRAYFINPKPRNFLHPASQAELNRTALFKATTEGKLGTEMPAWGKVLSPQEVADVSEFVFQRFIRQPAAVAKNANTGK
ncbi:c-type cytochrome [Noviherbaspirillum sp.]|uniref:c-type cytochrome n=1 Tax=Noviherbaspirillum sp. TaxID=1926288 RepID=UPI002B45DEFA|nr:c-type cytochrome [Noviherbaspirillum sp.]HJV81291.1 c-type cytochrome [Noviherbaspirillum sp.]